MEPLDEDEVSSQLSNSSTPSVTSDEESNHEQNLDTTRERFQGSKTKYRGHTKPERDLAASLDALEAENLSIHLYNAHAWKRRVGKSREANKNLRPSASNPTSRRKLKVKDNEWQPRPLWTAWPLQSEIVPRPWERFMHYYEVLDNDNELIRKQQKSRGKISQPLEDCLLSEILKQAKEQFRSNELHVAQEPEFSKPSSKRRKIDSNGTSPQHRDRRQDPSGSYESENTEVEHAGSEDLMQESVDSDNSANMATTSERRNSLEELESFKPGIMTDEEAARTLAQPAIRHVLSRLDALLMALHHSRRHLYDWGYSETATESSTDSRHLRNRATQVPELFYTRAPRDWSELLHAAALVGWDSDVLRRTADRCSALFGESISFRTLHENEESNDADGAHYDSKHNPDQMSQIHESHSDVTTEQEPTTYNSTFRPKIDPDLLVCLVPSCSKYMSNFPGASKFQAHMKREHGFDGDVRFPPPEDAPADDLIHLSDELDQEMVGGVHVDGFLKPVLLRKEWAYTKRMPGTKNERRDN